MSRDRQPVLILGAGINGAALARELVLGGLSVVMVDTADVAYGATASSSRLIHGGLRYLEYGELDLVRESLAERKRLLRLAPQFVRLLKLFIPLETRFGGLGKSLMRFAGLERPGGSTRPRPSRGLWLVRGGLWLYDLLARDPDMPTHEVYRVGDARAARVNHQKYRWLCAYYDAQILYPERFVIALLEDARRVAAAGGTKFEVFTYHRAVLTGRAVEIRPLDGTAAPVAAFEPSALVNATGAWVDRTLRRLEVPSRTLIGGTKGSHLVTSSRPLRALVGEHGLYAEAADGRPVFVLPFGESTLVGTTEVPFDGDPADAVATAGELDYLLRTVNEVVPAANLTPADVDLHYCGVRPLPCCGPAAPASITRRHWLEEHAGSAVPVYSVIGGKLTTCRSLADEAAETIFRRLGVQRLANSRDRVVPGGASYPADPRALAAEWDRLSASLGASAAQVRGVWTLYGTRTAEVLAESLESASRPPANLAGTSFPLSLARWVIRHEWVRRLADLVERRLMLLFEPRLSEACLRQLAALVAEEGAMDPGDVDWEVQSTIERLQKHFGKRVVACQPGDKVTWERT